MHAVRQHTGGYQNQEVSGHRKELLEIDLHCALVKQVTDNNRGADAQHETCNWLDGGAGGLHCGEEEECGL